MTIEINISKALRQLDDAEKAMRKKEPTQFWLECVRDARGKWAKYSGKSSRFGVKYFRGHQPKVNYDDSEEVTYLQNSIIVRRAFYMGLEKVNNMTLSQFQEWLENLRRTLEYRPVDEWLHQRFATHAHTIIVEEEVIPLAQEYGDIYKPNGISGPQFAGFPKNALPYDETENDQIIHHYPKLDVKDYYLNSALISLKIIMKKQLNEKEYIYEIAKFYQLLINLHYFAAMNASLYMNLANGLLEIAGIPGIENGIIDFVALRLQPENFAKYFYDEVVI